MNGRCHNDPMDFATEVCDSCGEQFCPSCLVYPRGSKKPPLCTHCAMALSGVRNRRPVKPLGRGEIRKRRKNLKANLEAENNQAVELELPGTHLINAPEIEAQLAAEDDDGGRLGRFFRRKDDVKPEPDEEQITADLPEPTTTVLGGNDDDYTLELMGDSEAEHETNFVVDDAEPGQDHSSSEHSSATAILQQLRDQDGDAADDNVWLPPAGDETPTWSLPDIEQSPLGDSSPLKPGGPWEGIATDKESDAPEPVPVAAFTESAAPMFVSEKELKAEGPADTDTSGNWVPPTLRGMAPQAQSNADELPRRRRRSD